MSSTTTWGALVAASLAAGCSAAPAQPAGPAPSPPPSPPTPVASAPPPFQPSLSPPLDVLPEPSGGEDEHVGSLSKLEIPYGRGVLLYEHLSWGNGVPACPLVRDDGCSSHTVSTNGKNPDERAWLDATASPPPDARPGKRLPSPRDWIAFSPSRDAIFALAQGGKIIDRIDDQGQVTRLAQDNAMEGWHQLRIVEQGDRLMALGQTRDESMVVGEILPAASASEPRKLGPLTVLPMSPIPRYRQSAQGARQATHKGKLAMAGTPRFVSLPDEGDKKNLWAMVWIEAVPPPFDWPAGKPRGDGAKAAPNAPPKAQGKAQTKGAKHGCGGPGSRSLTDRSVEKKVHITRFSGASQLDDKVAWANNSLDPLRPLVVRLDEGKLVVEPSKEKPSNPYAFPPGEQHESVYGKAPESLVAAAFDAESKEGLIVVRSGKKTLSRRFNAEGAFVGEPVAYPHDLHVQHLDLARSGKNWLARMPYAHEIHNLTEPSDPHPWKLDDHYPLGLVPGQPHAHLLFLREQKGKNGLYLAPLDEQGKMTGDPELVVDLAKGMDTNRSAIQTAPGSPPFFAILEQLDENTDGGKYTTRNRIAWTSLKPGSTWTNLPDLPQAPPADNSYLSRQTVNFKRVDGDLVAWLPQGKERLLAWVRAGKVISVADAPEHSALGGELHHQGTTGNILGKGELRLPTQPGPPVASPELAEAERQCAYVMPTGPATTVLACARPTDPSQIAIRVSLRLHRSEPPASH